MQTILELGPSFHSLNGYIAGFTIEELTIGEDLSNFYYKGKWMDSFEAHQQLKQLGVAEKSVCHTSVGYASGYLSTILGQQVIGRELTCAGKGDADCTFEMMFASSGNESVLKELPYYEENPIVKELDTTFEQLIEQKTHLLQVSDFQRKLTESIAKGSDLQEIASIVYNLIQIPVTIEFFGLGKGATQA